MDETLERWLQRFNRDWPDQEIGSIFLREKLSEITDLACLGRSEEFFEV